MNHFIFTDKYLKQICTAMRQSGIRLFEEAFCAASLMLTGQKDGLSAKLKQLPQTTQREIIARLLVLLTEDEKQIIHNITHTLEVQSIIQQLRDQGVSTPESVQHVAKPAHSTTPPNATPSQRPSTHPSRS
jgi:hypothetical protein